MNITFNKNGPMTKEIFEQNPKLFMNMAVGSLVIGRINNNEANRLQNVFDRPFIRDIFSKEFSKESYTWEEYKLVYECCV